MADASDESDMADDDIDQSLWGSSAMYDGDRVIFYDREGVVQRRVRVSERDAEDHLTALYYTTKRVAFDDMNSTNKRNLSLVWAGLSVSGSFFDP